MDWRRGGRGLGIGLSRVRAGPVARFPVGVQAASVQSVSGGVVERRGRPRDGRDRHQPPNGPNAQARLRPHAAHRLRNQRRAVVVRGQAVPLVVTEAPLVGTGMEGVVAKDSGVAAVANRSGVVESVDSTRIVIRCDEDEKEDEDDEDADTGDNQGKSNNSKGKGKGKGKNK